MKRLWELVHDVQLGLVKRSGIGTVRSMVAGLRATRARGITAQSHVQAEEVKRLNMCLRDMLPSARYAAFAVVVHGFVKAHCDDMNMPGELSYTVAEGACALWIRDPGGDREVCFKGQRLMGREHTISKRWCVFNSLKAHAVFADAE
eukprot:5151009-Amphidinium_carterae.2